MQNQVPPICTLNSYWLVQGNPDSHRRNYSGLLEDVAAAPELLRDDRFEIDLFSWGELEPEIVPASVVSKMVYKHLEFPVSKKMLQAKHLSRHCMQLILHFAWLGSASVFHVHCNHMHQQMAILPSNDVQLLCCRSFIIRSTILWVCYCCFLATDITRQPALPVSQQQSVQVCL